MVGFRDRAHAGRKLGEQLARFMPADASIVVLGLPRGGVPVARGVADALDAPLEVLGVRKLGLPDRPEFGIGAIGEGDVRVLDDEFIGRSGISEREIEEVEAAERRELERRVAAYRGPRPARSLHDHVAVIVDDGLATGGTARAAVGVARAMGARRVVVAVPVAPRAAVDDLEREADEVIVTMVPRRFRAVGEWYEDFTPTSDAEVVDALSR